VLRPCRPDVPYGSRKREREREGRETLDGTLDPFCLALTPDRRDAIRSYFLDGISGIGQCPMNGSYDEVSSVTIGGPVLGQGT